MLNGTVIDLNAALCTKASTHNAAKACTVGRGVGVLVNVREAPRFNCNQTDDRF